MANDYARALRDENTRLQNEIADLRGENAMLRSTKTNDIGVWRDKWREQNARIYELERTLGTKTAAYAAQRDAMRAGLQRAENKLANTLSLLGDVMRLLAAGAGEFSDEYKIALGLIGAVPSGDISAPQQAIERDCVQCGTPLNHAGWHTIAGTRYAAFVCNEHGVTFVDEREL